MEKVREIGPSGPHQTSEDVLTEILRKGSQRLVAEALEAEREESVGRFRESKDDDERQRVVRNGYLLTREVQTGIGSIEGKVPWAGDREGRFDPLHIIESSALSAVIREYRGTTSVAVPQGQFDG